MYSQALFIITIDWIKSNIKVVEKIIGHNKVYSCDNGKFLYIAMW